MAPQLLVDCLVHHAHATLPQPADEFVMTKQSPWRQFLHSTILPLKHEPGKKSWELKRNPPRGCSDANRLASRQRKTPSAARQTGPTTSYQLPAQLRFGCRVRLL